MATQSPLQPIPIASATDPRIELYQDVRDKDLKGRDKIFMAESEMVLRRLLRTPERIHSVFLAPDRFENLREDLTALPPETPIYLGDVGLMTAVAGFHIHRGVLAAGHRLHPTKLFLEPALGHLRGKQKLTILVAERFTNVDNMGSLFRNAAAFGVDAIALDPHCCDPLYRKAIRVSMGHALSIPYGILHYGIDDLKRLKEEWGCTLVAAEITPNAKPLWQLPNPGRIAIILGSEAEGISPATLEICDHICHIPMNPAVPSLNVAMASAVFLYERQRQQQQHEVTSRKK